MSAQICRYKSAASLPDRGGTVRLREDASGAEDLFGHDRRGLAACHLSQIHGWLRASLLPGASRPVHRAWDAFAFASSGAAWLTVSRRVHLLRKTFPKSTWGDTHSVDTPCTPGHGIDQHFADLHHEEPEKHVTGQHHNDVLIGSSNTGLPSEGSLPRPSQVAPPDD